MSKKRRKCCKSRDNSENHEQKSNEHPAEDDNCEQRCITDFGNKGTMNFKENTLSTSPLQGLETTDENSNTLPCCDKNGNEGFTGKHEAKCKVPENIADNTLGRGEETKCQSTNTEDLPKDVIAVVTLNESNTSSSGRIIIQHSPSPAKPSCSTKGPMTTEVNCDCLNVNVKLKKSCISNSETHLLIEKRKCPKKSRSYHDRQHQRSQCFSYHKYENTADTSIKHEQAAINVADVASEDTTTLKVSITGKDIEVKYNSNIQNVVVHIEPTEHKKTYNGSSKKRHKSCNSNDSDYPQTDESCISCPLSDVRKKCYANHKCPEWYSDIPPPTEFADCKDLYSNIIRDDGCEGLPSAIDKALTLTDEPTMLAEQCGVSKVKDIVTDIENKIKQNICMHELKHNLHDQQESDTASEACVSMQPSYHSSHAAHLKSHRNAYGPIAKDNISLAPKAMRRNTFPEAMNVTFLPFHHRRDSILAQWSSPAFHSLPEQEQAAEVALEELNDHKNEPHKSVSCASSLSSLLESKPSQANDSMPSDQERALSISEPEESADDVFLNDNEDVFMGCEAKRDILSFPSWQNVEPDLKMDDEECKPARNLSEEHTEFTESGFDEELLDSDNHNDVLEHSEICSNPLPITTNPPFEDQATKHCPEKMNLTSVHADSLHSQPQSSVYPYAAEPEVTGKRRRGSVVTVVTGEQEQRVIIHGESLLAQNLCGVSANNRNQKDFKRSDSILMPVSDMEEPEDNELHSCFEVQNMFQNSLVLEEINLQDNSTLTPEPLVSTGEDKTHTVEALFKGASDVVNHPQGDTNDISDKCKIAEPQQGASSESAISLAISEAMAYPMLRLVKSDSESYDHKKAEKQATRKHLGKRDSKVGSKHLKLPNTELLLKDTRGNETFHDEGSDRWAKRRKQFKESKNFGSTGGSSAASNITEDSGNSEDTRSVDLGFRADNDEKGFYTENFHSASWIFRGDDGSPDNSPRCLSKRPRPVAIRERTVRIAKGLGDYPWGFRIQFSKPILVTEVDTNGAAEEAGLQVGDIVMAVNGTDVTSIAHSEAAGLARQGPDLLTLVVGSDVSRCPNTPKPTCRGYLHKRTHSGILKGWRKRWFVLKHDGCLYYYKQKKDEGKCRPLEVMKLEGSEIGMDTTLGKPFVFRCVPHSGSRTYYFCATSNQEMKRWLEAMEKAGHPVNQNHVWVDVTLHNNSLPPLAIKNPECLGLLHQLDRNRDMWIPHYCILKDGCLYFYASMRATHGQGGLYLQGYTVSEQCIGSKGRCVIEVKPPSEEFKTFYLSAENVTENKRWITALKISISKWLPLHQAIQDFMNRPLEETRM